MPLMKPQSGEYAPYYEKYISLVPGDDVQAALQTQGNKSVEWLSTRGAADGDFRYAPDKWTLKEVLGHIADSERIFTYRALRIARGDRTPIEGFEQDDYVRGGAFHERTLNSLVQEFNDVRRSTIALYSSLTEEAWARHGIANKNEVTVRALAFITAGHELHHMRILQERYFPLRQHA